MAGLSRPSLQASCLEKGSPSSDPEGHISSRRAHSLPLCPCSSSEPGVCDHLQLGCRVGDQHRPRQVCQLDVYPEREHAWEALLHFLGFVFTVSFEGRDLLLPSPASSQYLALSLIHKLLIEIERRNDSCLGHIKSENFCIYFFGIKLVY